MEDTDQSTTVRAGLARTSQACQRCRSLKTRCLPSAQPGRCQRCFTAVKACVFAEASRRERKLRAPSRIAQVEQKIDGLVAKLVNAAEPGSGADPVPVVRCPEPCVASIIGSRREIWLQDRTVAPGSWMPVPSFEPTTVERDQDIEKALDTSEADRRYLHELRTVHSFSDQEVTGHPPASLFRPSRQSEPPIDDELVQRLLSTEEADVLVNEYRRMSASFPFVIIPDGVTAIDLYETKPMLLLAILTVASWKAHVQQMSLDVTYRKELANRTLINPRRNLSLVQSVLVYLSWYHFVFSHKTQQIFFLHHLVVGLALDIGLHQDYQPLNFPNQPIPPPPPAGESREKHRAFLGCYYLASMIAAGLQKPNLLKHTAQMTEWARALERVREYQSDETIRHLIILRQIDDQIQDTLFADGTVPITMIDARTLMHMRFMETQLEAWMNESSGAAFRRLLDLSSSFTDMLLHSVALRTQTGEPPKVNDSTHLSALVSALEAGKRFFDTMLSFPASEYHLISFCEWMRLPTVIMTVARLCMPSDSHAATGWDVKAAQDRTRLDLYLEALCYRIQSLSTYDKSTQPHPDFWYAMRFIVDLTKTWYLRKIKPGDSSATHFTSSSSVGQAVSTISGHSSMNTIASTTHQESQRYNKLAGINYMDDIDLEIQAGDSDDGGPFAAFKDTEFDMEQFLDVGIWGDESYIGMGFGGV